MSSTNPAPEPHAIYAVCQRYPGSHGDRYPNWASTAKVQTSLSERCAYFCDEPPIFVAVYSEAEEKNLKVLALAAEVARHGAVNNVMEGIEPCDATAGEIAVAAIEQMQNHDDPERWPGGAATLRFDHRSGDA